MNIFILDWDVKKNAKYHVDKHVVKMILETAQLLCGIPSIEEQYESGILKSDLTVQHEELLTTVLFVVKMGPDCYKDAAR